MTMVEIKFEVEKTHRVVLEIISVKKFKLLFRQQQVEAEAKQIDLLLDEPPSKILSVKYHYNEMCFKLLFKLQSP